MDGDLEVELVKSARRGDPSAGPFLVSCYGERLLGYARALAPDLSDADREQIVELAIEAGVRAIDKFDAAKGSLHSWFRGQVRFQTLSWRRRVPPMNEATDQLVDPTRIAPDHEKLEALRRAIARLGADDQLILALRSSERIAFPEIAQRLGVAAATARQRHHRALQRLRAETASEPHFARLVKEANSE